MSKKISKLRKTKVFLNQLTLFLVLTLGFMSSITILTAPADNPKWADLNPSSASRAIASVKPFDPSPEHDTISVLTLDCLGTKAFTNSSPQVRLKGKVCDTSGAEIQSSQVRNIKNEDVATVFHRNREYTTDLIHLVPGENELTIKFKLSNGKTETKLLKIHRN